MTEPFVLNTVDPRFDATRPVVINGFTYAPDVISIATRTDGEPVVPATDAIMIWRSIEILTDGEGDTVTVLPPNPDFNGQPSYAIECNGAWTDWQDRRFAADRQVDCFEMAVKAKGVANG